MISRSLLPARLLVACSPTPERIAVEAPSDWRRVKLGGFSIALPKERFLDGFDNGCGILGAPAKGCMLFDEGPAVNVGKHDEQ